jgi:uncharacterized Zn finger protein (UPF0148 family)
MILLNNNCPNCNGSLHIKEGKNICPHCDHEITVTEEDFQFKIIDVIDKQQVHYEKLIEGYKEKLDDLIEDAWYLLQIAHNKTSLFEEEYKQYETKLKKLKELKL